METVSCEHCVVLYLVMDTVSCEQCVVLQGGCIWQRKTVSGVVLYLVMENCILFSIVSGNGKCIFRAVCSIVSGNGKTESCGSILLCEFPSWASRNMSGATGLRHSLGYLAGE